MLVLVYTYQNATLLDSTCRGSDNNMRDNNVAVCQQKPLISLGISTVCSESLLSKRGKP